MVAKLYNLTSSRAKSGDPEVVNFTLAKLPELTLEWCPKLGRLDAIGKLTKLKVLDLWASKVPVPAWTKLEPILRKRKVVIGNLPDNIDDDASD